MGIMDRLFGNASAVNANQPNPGIPVNPNMPQGNMNPQGQQVAPNNISSAANPNVPSGVAHPAHSSEKVATGENPLDGYKELWQPVKQPEGTVPTSIVPMLDPSKLNESIKTANFMQGISPDLIQSAMKGDANAFQQVMNEQAKAVFSQALLAARSLTDTSITAFGKSQESSLPGMVKSHMVRDSMAENPLYKHEATRPLMSALESQLSQKYPTASAAEISAHAQNYIKEFVQVATPQQQQQEQRINRRDDFSTFE